MGRIETGKPIPFECSPEARGKILGFIKAKPDMDTELALSEGGLEMRNATGTVVLLKVEGDHFPLGYRPKGAVPPDTLYELSGQKISIAPATLKHLEGKKLVLRTYAFGKFLGLFNRYRASFLKSEPNTQPKTQL
jgi:hypothetical protein